MYILQQQGNSSEHGNTYIILDERKKEKQQL